MTTPDRVAGNFWINGNFLLSRVTGGERYALELSRRLLRYPGWKIAVAPGFDCAPLADYADRIMVVAPGLMRSGWTNLALPRALPPGGLLLSPVNLGPLLVRRQLLTLHDVASLDHPEWFSAQFARTYRWQLPWLGRSVRRILTVSEYSRKRIAARLGVPESKIAVAPCGVTAEFNPHPSERRQGLRQKFELPERYLLSVGTLDPRKNIEGLVSAWQTLPAGQRQRCPLVLAGGNAASFAPTSLGKLISGDHTIRHLGYVSQDDLPALYAEAAAFVFPSLYEGFGLPVLEAMACGTPVLSSAATSLPEVGGDAVVYFDPRKPEEIRAILERFLAGGIPTAAMRENGIRRAARFSWETTAVRVHEEALQQQQ